MKHEQTSKRLQFALSNANMKPQELADKSGVSKSSISQYINGSHTPSNISSGKMGKILNVEPLWLMGFDVPMNREHTLIDSDKDYAFYQKYSLLSERDKKIVVHMVDSMLAEKNNALSSDTEDAEASYIKNLSNSAEKTVSSASSTIDGTDAKTKEASSQ